MASEIALILEILSDGKWHGIEELRRRIDLNAHKMQEITMFLIEFDFAQIDNVKGKVKINSDFQKFLAETKT